VVDLSIIPLEAITCTTPRVAELFPEPAMSPKRLGTYTEEERLRVVVRVIASKEKY
jgi:hypothetical protein